MTDITDIRKARREFNIHKGHAKARGIEFKLTFEQWCKIWEESGHYQERGRGVNQYGMQRFMDLGPYEVGNVEIKHPYDNAITRVLRSSFSRVSSVSMRSTSAKLSKFVPKGAWCLGGKPLRPDQIIEAEEEEDQTLTW